MDSRRRLETRPVAADAAIVQGDRFRITVLADGLLRLEYALDGRFEDRASAFAVFRELPVPRYRLIDGPHHLEILTDRVHLVYDREQFSTSGLSIQVRGNISSYHSVWRFGEAVDDLGGTARTLDNADGAVPLEPGVVSRWGYAVLDDSRTLVLDDDGWVAPRDGSRADLYFFGYGRDYRDAVRALYAVSGPTPVLPRFALGNWWSRFHPYTAAEYTELIGRFEREGIPFSVAVIDMDWHLIDVDPQYGSGWTGYSWNRALFPDPAEFLAWLHEHGLRVTLNVHPADGVRAFEDAYAEMAAAMGIDAATGDPIAVRRHRPAIPHRLFRRAAPLAGARRGGLLVDRLAVRPALADRRRRPAVDAEPLPLPGQRARRQAPVDLLPVRRARQPPLSGRVLRRQPGHLGVPGLPALLHRDRLEHRLRLVEPRHRRPHVRQQGRRAGHPLGAAGGLLADHAAALLGTARSTARSRGGSAAEAQAVMTEFLRLRHRLLPYLHTMNHRAAQGRLAVGRADVLVAPGIRGRLPGTEPVPLRHRAARRAHHHPDRPQPAARAASGRGCRRAPGSTSSPAWSTPAAGSSCCTATWPTIPVLARAGAIVPLAGAPVPGNSPENPDSFEVLVVVGADGTLRADRGRRHRHRAGSGRCGPNADHVRPVRRASSPWAPRRVALGLPARATQLDASPSSRSARRPTRW